MNNKIMKALADLTNLQYDGGEDDTSLHYDEERINVVASLMSKSNYNKMETLLRRKQIKGKGYIVSAWNDCSGYEYWSQDEDEMHYIQITAYITDLNKVDPDKLKEDCEKLFNFFHSRFDNLEEYYYKKSQVDQ